MTGVVDMVINIPGFVNIDIITFNYFAESLNSHRQLFHVVPPWIDTLKFSENKSKKSKCDIIVTNTLQTFTIMIDSRR